MTGIHEQPNCFGNYNPESKICKNCSVNRGCHNDLAGMNASGILGGLDKLNQIEGLLGEAPDWVYDWDELSEQELATMERENPEKWNLYNHYSPGLSD